MNLKTNSFCYFTNYTIYSIPDTSVITFYSSVFPSGSQLQLSLTVCTYNSSVRICSDSVFQNIFISTQDYIDQFQLDTTGKNGMVVNMQDTILVGTYSSSLIQAYEYLWNIGNLSANVFEDLGTGNIYNKSYLRIKPYSLSVNKTYPLILSRYIKSTMQNMTIQINVTVNNPPNGGALIVTPLSGVEDTTQFTLQAIGWIDSDGNFPLSYRFGFRNVANSSIQYISTTSTSSICKAYLPTNINNQVELWVEVYDSLGGMSNYSISVIVANSTIDISSAILTRMQSASINSPSDFVNGVSEFLSFMNAHKNDNNSKTNYPISFLQGKFYFIFLVLNDSLELMNTMNSESRETIALSFNPISKLNSTTTTQVDVNAINVLNYFLDQEMTRLSNFTQSAVSQWKTRTGLRDTAWLSVADTMDNIFKKSSNTTNLPTSSPDIIRMIGRGYINSLLPSTSINITKDTFSVVAKAYTSPTDINNLKFNSSKGSVTLPSNGLNMSNINIQRPVALIYSETPKAIHGSVPVSTRLRSSAAISISAYDLNSSNLMNISNLSLPIQLNFLQVEPTLYSKTRISCYFYNNTLKMFSSRGMGLIQSNLSTNSVTCASSHFTDFTLLEMSPDPINTDSIWRKTGVLVYIGLTFVSFSALVVVALYERAIISQENIKGKSLKMPKDIEYVGFCEALWRIGLVNPL